MTNALPLELNLSITFRHTESTEALKSAAQQKVTHCLEKYMSGHVDAQVVLSVEKRDHAVEVIVKAKDFDISCKSATDDLYTAIDKVMDAVETQIRKQKDRLKSHRHETIREVDAL